VGAGVDVLASEVFFLCASVVDHVSQMTVACLFVFVSLLEGIFGELEVDA
jgi:hypothetical protein